MKKAKNAHVAQSVERILGKDKVTGSIPVVSSKGGVAQLARAHGSYPWSPGFESLRRHHAFLTGRNRFNDGKGKPPEHFFQLLGGAFSWLSRSLSGRNRTLT